MGRAIVAFSYARGVMMSRRFLLAASLAAAGTNAVSAGRVTVFAAASLTDVLRRLESKLGAVRLSFAASSTLARQIEHGAPADIFISADEAWMDHLGEGGHVDTRSRRVFAGNRLVVVGPGAPAEESTAADSDAAVRDALRASGRIATGDPAHVPVGRYAEAALRAMGLWDAMAPRLVRADNVRSALAFVERGEAAAGIVYATDAAASSKVRVLARFPAAHHAPIVYPAALTRDASAAARRLFPQLFAPTVQAVLREAGFSAVP